jgi:hypothetical protein
MGTFHLSSIRYPSTVEALCCRHPDEDSTRMHNAALERILAGVLLDIPVFISFSNLEVRDWVGMQTVGIT